MELVRIVEELAEEKAAKPSQVALAWVLAKGDDIVPIPGTKRRKYLEENVAAAEVEWVEDPTWPGAQNLRGIDAVEARLREITQIFPVDQRLEEALDAG